MHCPACSSDIDDASRECPSCGVIVAKWRPEPRTRTSALHKASASPLQRLIRIIALSLVGAAILVGVYWFVRIRPRMKALAGEFDDAPGRAAKLAFDERDGDFDQAATLPGGPSGAAWRGDELIIGNREEPRGFLRIRRDGKKFTMQKVPVIESTYGQQIQIDTVTWNGTNFIGYADGAWFGRQNSRVFTVHDPRTLRVTRWHPAPELLGCLAWDGSQFWAATRRNTRDANEPAYLYRIDSSFNVVAKSEPPGFGCQGLAWDGQYLWYADVFSDSLLVIDVSGDSPKTIHTASLPVQYPSGLAFDGQSIWLTEYGENRLMRLSRRAQEAWGGLRAERPQLASAVPISTESSDELHQKLRSENSSERFKAKMELERLGQPIDYDRRQNSFPKPQDSETADFLDTSVELRGSDLYGSWEIYFGNALFTNQPNSGVISMPQFARYEVSVRGGSLSEEVRKSFDAVPGVNRVRDELLASGLGAGKYDIHLFIHVQYVAPDGTNRILNYSGTSLEVSK